MAPGALKAAGLAAEETDPTTWETTGRASPGKAPAAPLARALQRDRLVVALLVLVPFLGFAIPSFLGHPLLTGDNLIQNAPLRALVGTELAKGHLPLWNADTWSGTALLAGVNAGAAYPTTWLFALLPERFAWGLVVWAAYALAATGVFAYCRGRGRSLPASASAAIAFAFSGFFLAQGVHIELVQAWSTVPWAVAAVDGMARAEGRRRAAWLGLFAASVGLTGLAGSPEALAWGLGLVALYALWLVLVGTWPERGGRGRLPTRAERARLVLPVAGGLVIGALLSAIQWLPAKAWIDLSQRSSTTFTYFASGSIDPRLLLLAFDPFLFGASGPIGVDPAAGATGRLGIPAYFGTFNLAELSFALGLVVLVAVVSLLARALGDPERRQWRIWAVLGGLELVVALGDYTPLAHLLYLVPLVHSLRLPNRALGGTDLAMAILLAWWVDRVLRSDLLTARGPVGRRLRRLGAATMSIPVLLALALVFSGAGAISLLSLQRPAAKVAPFVTATHAYALGVALVAVVVGLGVLGAHRLGTRRVSALLGAVFVLQVVTFGLGQSWAEPASSALVHATSHPAEELRALADGGRVAIVDPAQQDVPGELALGEADLNITEHLGSVQGYGSVVPERYERATHTHTQGDLQPALLASPLAAELRLAAVAVPSSDLLTPVTAKPSWTKANRDRVGWWLGRSLRVRSLRLRIRGVPARSTLAVSLLGRDGRTTLERDVHLGRHGVVELSFSPSVETSGVEVRSSALGGDGEAALAVETTSGQRWQPSRGLGTHLAPSQWHETGQVVDMTLFQARRIDPPAWTTSDTPVVQLTRSITGDDRFRLTPGGPTTLVRSETFAPGWTATIRLASGAVVRRAVVADGVLQAVRLPAGAELVSFDYRAPWLERGMILSTLALVGIVASLAVGLPRRGRSPARRPT